jgi:uncharacterized SAM-binding protein YcdF (DUF218 family)
MIRRGGQRKDPSQTGGVLSSLITLTVAVLLLAVLYLARHPIFRLVGEGWVVEDTLERSDAILVLSDDNFYADRATHAAQVYRQGFASVVVASGRRLRPYAGISELMEHDLIERGVPKDKIIRVAHDAQNTREEAKALAQLAKQKKWRSIIVVTSNYHTRRTRYIFSRVFPKDIRIRVSGASDGEFDPERWWEKRVSVKELAQEMTAMLVAIWEQHTGSDGPTPRGREAIDKSQLIVAPGDAYPTKCGVVPHVTPQYLSLGIFLYTPLTPVLSSSFKSRLPTGPTKSDLL